VVNRPTDLSTTGRFVAERPVSEDTLLATGNLVRDEALEAELRRKAGLIPGALMQPPMLSRGVWPIATAGSEEDLPRDYRGQLGTDTAHEPVLATEEASFDEVAFKPQELTYAADEAGITPCVPDPGIQKEQQFQQLLEQQRVQEQQQQELRELQELQQQRGLQELQLQQELPDQQHQQLQHVLELQQQQEQQREQQQREQQREQQQREQQQWEQQPGQQMMHQIGTSAHVEPVEEARREETLAADVTKAKFSSPGLEEPPTGTVTAEEMNGAVVEESPLLRPPGGSTADEEVMGKGGKPAAAEDAAAEATEGVPSPPGRLGGIAARLARAGFKIL